MKSFRVLKKRLVHSQYAKSITKVMEKTNDLMQWFSNFLVSRTLYRAPGWLSFLTTQLQLRS